MSIHVSGGNLRKYLEPGETTSALGLVIYQLAPLHEMSKESFNHIIYTHENQSTTYNSGSLVIWANKKLYSGNKHFCDYSRQQHFNHIEYYVKYVIFFNVDSFVLLWLVLCTLNNNLAIRIY